MIRFTAPKGIGDALIAINSDVKNHFSLGYYAPDGVAGWRNIKVSLASSDLQYRLRHQQRYLIK